MKIGLLVPFSGEFPGLKRALLNCVSKYAKATGAELVTEYIGNGEGKLVEKAIDKLFYNDDADVIIGYVGYRVMTNFFTKISKYSDKLFIHLSLGEVIPYSASAISYPVNYRLVSLDAWRSIAYLGRWVADELPADDCLICTSIYDSGYSLTDSFRIGYHSETSKTLQSTILKNPPKESDVSGLFSEIRRIRPGHLHITLCGRELDNFLAGFEQELDYEPSVSFAFPVAMKNIVPAHPSLQKAYSAIIENALPEDIHGFISDPFTVLFNHLGELATGLLDNKEPEYPDKSVILQMNFAETTVKKIESGILPQLLNAQFNYSAEQQVSVWQNPYLCI